MPVLETVRNISFLSTILELFNEIAVISETVRNRIYVHFNRMTDTMTSQNIDLSSLVTPYVRYTILCTMTGW
jgi:hypothetical protein